MQIFMNASASTAANERPVNDKLSRQTQKEMGRAGGRLEGGGGVIAGMVQDELWTKGGGTEDGLFVDVDEAAEGSAEGKEAVPVAGEPLAEVEFAEKPVDPYGIQGTNVNLPV